MPSAWRPGTVARSKLSEAVAGTTCSYAGIATNDGWAFTLIGAVVASALVGWVFAVARLNSEVNALRAQLSPPAGGREQEAEVSATEVEQG